MLTKSWISSFIFVQLVWITSGFVVFHIFLHCSHPCGVSTKLFKDLTIQLTKGVSFGQDGRSKFVSSFDLELELLFFSGFLDRSSCQIWFCVSYAAVSVFLKILVCLFCCWLVDATLFSVVLISVHGSGPWHSLSKRNYISFSSLTPSVCVWKREFGDFFRAAKVLYAAVKLYYLFISCHSHPSHMRALFSPTNPFPGRIQVPVSVSHIKYTISTEVLLLLNLVGVGNWR